ncbi:YibE/F family protein [Pseudonocardia hispaniensis]|uniref:YibE/F family protein n=1 Tax=Pseudonocardia hispaniensis TaxID=904933 RepID=A0ABW1J1E7_9PSEU
MARVSLAEPPEPPRGGTEGRHRHRRRRARGMPAPPGPVGLPSHGHGHGHGHGPAAPAGRRVRTLIAALLIPCALATLVGLVLLRPTTAPPTAKAGVEQPINAQVVAAQRADCVPGSGDGGCTGLVVRMAGGPLPGRDLVQLVPVEPTTPRFAVGDEIVLAWSGADPLDPGSYRVADFQRGGALIWLAALFAGAVLLLGRWRGLAALTGLGLSFVVLLWFVMPAILAGRDPLAVAVVGSCLIMFLVLYLAHGLSARTSTAVLGTLLSLGLIGLLGTVFSAVARLTGLDDQSANLIATLDAPVDARGLLLAGIVIGALGVLDDVTITQTSAVWELRAANPGLGTRELFAAGMRIGRDHVSSAVNTLVLAYAGAALPLLLLFSVSGRSIGQVLTTQDVATEIVRTLVGSIGLVASVPITTALAAAVAVQEQPGARTAPEPGGAPAR